jgi:hypothetical protein
MDMDTYNVTSHGVARLSDYRTFLEAVDGVSDATMRQLHDQIEEQKGTPGSPTDWREPDGWIKRFHVEGILNDRTRDLALRIHEAGLNPRHWSLDAVRIAIKDATLEVTGDKHYRRTEYGRALSEGEEKATDRYLTANGMYAILGFLRDEDGQTLDNLAGRWQQWLHAAAGREARSATVLRDGLWTRITWALMPLGFIKSEGVPRRYFLTPSGAAKATELEIEEAGSTAPRSKRAHEVAVEDILKVGDLLGYRTARTPALRELLPKVEQANARASVYSKQIDACWRAELPLLGEIRVAIEVQDKGSIPDLVSRLKVIAPFCHYLIVVSDEGQIRATKEFITATGDEKAFAAKTVWMTPDQLREVRQEVSHLSSTLTPSVEGPDVADENAAAEPTDEAD